MENAQLKKAASYCHHLESLFQINCSVADMKEEKLCFQNDSTLNLCSACEKQLGSGCMGRRAFLRGVREAFRWDGVYIFFCDLQLVLISVFIADQEGNLTGGMTAGPLCMGNLEDVLAEISGYELRRMVSSMPCYSPEQIQSLAEIMLPVATYISGEAYGKAGRYFFSQESFLNQIYAEKIKSYSETDYYTYPILQEKELRSAIHSYDRGHAETVLNQILAYIYVANNTNLDAIKPRITELLIVISRAALDAGADEKEIDLLIQNSIRQVDRFTAIEDLSAWISTILQRFINASFGAYSRKHGDTIRRAEQYIQTHYQEKISLEELAAHVNLSPNYFCHIYKKETGKTIINYLNRVRIEKSRLLFADESLGIVDIANLCGFEDQSYFTKVFKSYVGMTPKKYRESRQEI